VRDEVFFATLPRALEVDALPRDALLPPLERFVVDRPLDDRFDRAPVLDDFPSFAAVFDDALFCEDEARLPVADERPLVDADRDFADEERFGRDAVVTVSAAAPIAPTAAPAAAPVSISPATSMTLSITRDAVVFAELDLFLLYIEDVFVFPGFDELDLLAITFASQCSQ